jgi:TonB family protein
MMKKLLMIFLIALSSTGVQAASFDCSKATYLEEKTVCNTPKLSQLDDQMTVLYFEARKKTTDLNDFERVKTNWILQKQTCESDVSCLERSYLQRIEVLEQISMTATSSTSASTSSASTGQSATAERNQSAGGLADGYLAKVIACISPGVSFPSPPRSTYNPASKFLISLKSDGQIAEVRLTKSSGFPNFDRAVETGIRRCAPFPRPSSGSYPGYIDLSYNMYSGELAPVKPLAQVSSAPTGQVILPPCQGSIATKWDMCDGTFTYTRGGKYVGSWKNGQRSGLGTFTYADGSKYVGAYKDDNRDGQGTLTYKSGAKYFGEFKDGEFGGHGTYTFADARTQTGTWRAGKLLSMTKLTTANGPFTVYFTNGRPQHAILTDNNLVSILTNSPTCQGNEVSNWSMCLGVEKVTKQYNTTEYVGEFKDGKYDGYGILLMSARRFYLGQFKDGKFHGHGIYTNRDVKFSYDGEWIDGRRNGQGSYIGQFGREYVGQWKDDKRNGHGTEFKQVKGKQESKTYVGAWQDDKRNGHGTEFKQVKGKQESKTYVGAWQDDKKHGQGTYTSIDDGSTGTGEWIRGDFVTATRENISKFNDDVVAQALNYVSGFVLDDIGKRTRSFFISNNAETNRPCTYKLVVDPTSDFKISKVQIDLNKGNPNAIEFSSQGNVYISRVEGLPEFRCIGCYSARVQRAWALIYKECKGTRKAF